MSKRSTRRREIEQLLALRASAGLSLRDLSARSGIPVGTLSWWSHRLRQETAAQSFAEVVIDGVNSASSVPAISPVLEIPEIVIRHPEGMSVELRGMAASQVVDRVLTRIDGWS